MFSELLYRFQEMEVKERELQQSIKSLPQFKELKRIKEKFAQNKDRLEKIKEVHEEVTRRLKKAEDHVMSLEEKQKELSQLLYAGTISNSKELESIDQQIKTLGEQISEISDEIIKMMEEREGFDQELSQVEHELQLQYREFNKLKLQYNRIKLNLEQEIIALEEDKSKVSSLIDEKSLTWYQERQEQFAGTPIGRILENHVCSGCRTVIPVTIVKETRMNPGDVFCEKCGRMLYAPELD